jgi:Family of unknown function (DUF6011)
MQLETAKQHATEVVRLPIEFWSKHQVPAVPLLQQLNEWVIKHNERRLPKWKFKFATDLAVQIHSRITRAHEILFEGRVSRLEGATSDFFLKPALLHDQQYWLLNFQLYSDASNAHIWTFKPVSTQRGRGCPASGLIELRQAVIEALHPDRFSRLHPEMMLSAQCLCCGKALTDPASVARWIGPECWGSASTNLPRILNALATSSE